MLITVTLPNLMISNLNSNTSQLLQHFYQGKKNSIITICCFFVKYISVHLKLKLYIPETGAALFNNPISSSNSDANTEEGNLIPLVLKNKLCNG